MKKHSFVSILRRYWIFYAFFLPVFVYYLLFHYKPLMGVVIAFKDYKFAGGIWGSPWTSEHGFHHFIRFLTSGEFTRVFGNTVLLAVMRIVFGFPAPIILALMLNEVRSDKYKKTLQTISYLPHFVSYVVVYAVLYCFFSYDGFINGVRAALGLSRELFLGNPAYYRWFFTFSNVWKEIGWGAIIYLAALSRVNVELYEAADLDGASRMQKLIHITLGELRPLISMQLVLTMGGLFSVSLDQTMVFTNKMVSSDAEVMSYYVYRVGLLSANQFSYSTAVGLFNSLLGLAMVLLTNWGAKKIDEDGGLW